jgi:dienelactone hydrolase
MTHAESTGMRRAWIALSALVIVTVVSAVIAYQIQSDFGKVSVTNEVFENAYGTRIRAKLFTPPGASQAHPVPGVVLVPGYQSQREMGDPIAVELSRRGIAALSIDAIGRGNSGIPGRDPTAPDFDQTYGAKAAFNHLKQLPFVDASRVAMAGHSLGGQMAYRVALEDDTVRALVMLGTAYDDAATPDNPRNLLMIYGTRDEFRDRMTQTRHAEIEWLASSTGRAPFAVSNPVPAKTYGRFQDGTARRVVFPSNTHMTTPHDAVVISEINRWLLSAFEMPAPAIEDDDQIWSIKEWATLVAYFCGILALIPLAFLLVRLDFFAPVRHQTPISHLCDRRTFRKEVVIDSLLMWLYLPASMVVFAIHKYVVRIDGVFPLMVVNVILFWFLLVNGIGFYRFKKWFRKKRDTDPNLLQALGLSIVDDPSDRRASAIAKAVLLALILFGFVYGLQWVLEWAFFATYRFIFPFASDLTLYRFWMWLLYAPLFALGFIPLSIFLHITLRLPPRKGWFATAMRDTVVGILVLILPMLAFASIQYLPLFINGAIPLVGPGGMFVLFVINIWHLIPVLMVAVPISVFCHCFTGRPYLGALVCGMVVAWMFTSSQVIAPIPI